MTKNELMEKHREIYDEIVSEAENKQKEAVENAVREERKRIQEIDEISGQVGDDAMVREAKLRWKR